MFGEETPLLFLQLLKSISKKKVGAQGMAQMATEQISLHTLGPEFDPRHHTPLSTF